MRIDNWSMDQVMQLPDWCFGRRWPVGLYVYAANGNPAWDISELALPEKCVVWEIVFWHPLAWTFLDTFRLALGGQLPTATAMMDLLRPLFHGVGMEGMTPRLIKPPAYDMSTRLTMRMPVEAASQNLILEVNPDATTSKDLQVVVVISSIPKEVPDWLISGQANALL